MIAYRYNNQLDPPAPMVQISLRRPDHGEPLFQPALVDSGADRTVIPARIVNQLNLLPLDVREFIGFAGEAVRRFTYVVKVGIHDGGLISIEAVADAKEDYILLGRDVLNQFRLLLDGPNQRLEIG